LPIRSSPVPSDLAIRVEEVSKQYRIGRARPGYHSLRETLAENAMRPFRALRERRNGFHPFRPGVDAIWALRDVSFDVRQGEIVGLIGRNGSGKSTLLKILARITSPTTGRAGVRGRVGSLLEVGTGFHPDLTGRDNVFLAGAVLGMRRAEIARNFDQIVDFAGVGQFIDTPVKRYSTGMYLRLAFAVAAHLEPEILLVDEVLAVGDAEFQRRCLGKLETVGHQGRTVLFVSHNMAAVLRLCPRVILLDHGQLVADGPAAEVTAAYLDAGLEIGGERCWPDPHGAPGDEVARLRAVRVLGPDGRPTTSVDIQQPFAVEIEYWNLKDREPLVATAVIRDAHGLDLFSSRDNLEPQWGSQPRPAGLYRSVCTIPGNFLNSGRITVDAAISHRDLTTWHVWEQSAVAFDVIDTGGVRGDYQGPWPGAIRPYLEWVTRLEAPAAEAGVPAGHLWNGTTGQR